MSPVIMLVIRRPVLASASAVVSLTHRRWSPALKATSSVRLLTHSRPPPLSSPGGTGTWVPVRESSAERSSAGVEGQTRVPSDSKEDGDEKERSRQSQVKATRYSLFALGTLLAGFSAFAVSEWGPPARDGEGRPVADRFSHHSIVLQYLLRTWDALWNWKAVLEEPVRELLLPDPLQAPYIQPPYTLIIEMNGILTHPEWSYRMGWRFKKRPFVDYLLQQCGPPLFELVIFTQDPGFTAQPLLDSLDPQGLIMYRLYRDSTVNCRLRALLSFHSCLVSQQRYVDGVRVKDLNCLNRDLTRVIHVDWNPDACKLNRDNCLLLRKWDGSDGDKSLFDLAQFIRAIATQEVQDVREVLSHYRGFEDPLAAFKERQRQLLQQEQEANEAANQRKSLVGSFRRN